MSDINVIAISGRLGQDPELAHVGSEGTAKATLRVASTRVYNKGGDKVENTTWVNVISWGRQAEVVKEYCTKGQEVIISGRLEIEDWEDKEGNKKKSTTIVADSIKFGAKPGGNTADEGADDGKERLKKALASLATLVDNGFDVDTAIKAIESKENL